MPQGIGLDGACAGPGAAPLAGSAVPRPPASSPSPWVVRWSGLVPPGGEVLDVACGSGRHLRWFASRGHPVVGVDRDAEALAGLADLADLATGGARWVQADIEGGPWPFPGQRFAAVVVTNYLWRPLLPAIVEAVDVGGVLLYETFAAGQETVGRPSRPEFLLRPGELLQAVAGRLRVVAYEDGFLSTPERYVQRIAAVRLAEGAVAPRWPLAQALAADTAPDR